MSDEKDPRSECERLKAWAEGCASWYSHELSPARNYRAIARLLGAVLDNDHHMVVDTEPGYQRFVSYTALLRAIEEPHE